MRGLPGSGKSTLAHDIQRKYGFEHCVICSTDDLFIQNGVYIFNPKRLGINHKINVANVEKSMKLDTQAIIVDNTNTTYQEMKPYVALALQYGYAVNVLEPFTPWKYDLEACAEKNSHGVQLDRITKMKERWAESAFIQGCLIGEAIKYYKDNGQPVPDAKTLSQTFCYGSRCR